MDIEHLSVLPREVEHFMEPLAEGARICDATLGGGGHTARLLELCPSCSVLGIDADSKMIERAVRRIGENTRLTVVHGWFDQVLAREQGFDRILIDLGVSMVHLRDAERGFSFRDDGPLDMRLDSDSEAPGAREYLETISEYDLADIIFRYGEERYSRRIARAICAERPESIRSTTALAECIRRAVPPQYRRGRNHPATRTFQAIRIAVNDELGRLERVLPLAAAALNPGGRLLVITFHSLEDRIVKHTFRGLSGYAGGNGSTVTVETPKLKEGERFVVVTRKPVVPDEDEVARNPAARSAKLRVLEKEVSSE
jgi:16S rRNA (cytosine1402-N4)-methyltransferase